MENDDENPIQPRVIDAPEVIWLNYGDLDHDDTHAALAAAGDVTWSGEPEFASDVRYVRAEIDRHRACHDELLKILEIVMCVAECPPVLPTDTVTVRGVKDMAHRINQWVPNVKITGTL